MSAGMGGHQSQKSESKVWLTPPDLLARLGRFDLDPCAVSYPRPWPTADNHIALPDDGLAANWFGRVWLNPPYGAESAPRLRKMGDHGNGLALIFARTETDLFQSVWQRATAILFLRGRITFYYPNGTRADHNGGAPSVLVAYGEAEADRLPAYGIAGQFFRLRGDTASQYILGDAVNDNAAIARAA